MENQKNCDCRHKEYISDIHSVVEEESGKIVNLCDKCFSEAKLEELDNGKSDWLLKGSL